MTGQSPSSLGVCEHCGAPRIAPGQSHCATCGGQLAQPPNAAFAPAPPPPAQYPYAPASVCPSCGAPLAPGTFFCKVCGRALSVAPQPTWTYPAMPATGPAPQAPARRSSTPIVVGLGLMGLVALVVAGALLASGTGGSPGTPSPSAIAAATQPTARITATPTPGAIPATHGPIVVGDYTIEITDATLSDGGFGGWVPTDRSADRTTLVLQATPTSGCTVDDLGKVKAWVTDETAGRYDAGATLSSENAAIWLYAVPRASHSFVWNFPTGEMIDLSPILSTASSVTPSPTAIPTPAGTPWYIFDENVVASLDMHRADIKAWNDANTPSATYSVVTKRKAHDQTDLAWLQANPPMECYTALYDDLVLYDNMDVKMMNDWLAGRYSTINKTSIPALNEVWSRLGDEYDAASAACS